MKLTKKDIGKYYLLFDSKYHTYFIGKLYNINNSIPEILYVMYVKSLNEMLFFYEHEVVKELKDDELILELI